MAGQTLHDRFEAAKHTIYGQNVERAICKATTEEIIGPKKKHLDYLIHCTNEPNVSVPEMCNFLILRTQQSSWVVVFKSLITAHHLMCYGNERFIQCMATNSCSFHLSNFVDRGGNQGYDMSIFVRRYAKYLNTKTSAYRFMGSDFCKLKRGKEEGVLRNMSTESLLKTLPVLHEQLDTLLDFDCNPDDLTNGAMNSCFVLLYRDLIQLFAAYNDGIINLFEKYFTMSKKHCKGALDIYKKFIVAMDKVSDFLKVAEVVGIDRGSIPDLTKAPSSLLEEMENHLTYLEGKKSQAISSKPESVQKAPVSSPNSASLSNTHEINGLTVDESIRRAVEEEAVIMNQLKEQRLKELATKQCTVPEAKRPDLQEKPAMLTSTSAENQESKQKASPPFCSNEDLMSLNILPSSSSINSQQQLPSNCPVFDPFGEMLQPESQASQATSTATPKEEDPVPEKLISSDLDSSLQSLVQNLDINGPKNLKKPDGQQWTSPKVQTRTGGVNWNPTVPLSNYPPNLYVTQIQPMPPGVMNLSAYGQPVAVMPTMVANQPYMVPGVSHVTVTPFGIVPRAPMSASPQHPQVFYGQSSPQHTYSGSSSNEKSSVDPFGVL